MSNKKPLRWHTRALSTLTIIMISLIAVALVVGAALTLSRLISAHTIEGSGNVVTRNFDFSDFTAVDVGGGFEVEITQSSSYSVRVTADNNTFDYINVYETDKTLTIGMKSGYSYRDVTLEADVAMPDLYAVALSGGTHGFANEFTSIHEFNLVLLGGSSIELEIAAFKRARALIGATKLYLDASGGSRADLIDFPVNNATVLLSGGSQADINLNGILDADLSGGSHLQYIGAPTMREINTSGGSTITEKQ